MSRIRSIHPGLWTDEAFMRLSANARLLYIGLWNEAFDDGVFEWKPLTLKAKLFPVDNVEVSELLAEIEQAGSIARRESPKPYGLIRNFRTYQRPKKPNSSGLLQDADRDYVGIRPESSEPVPNQFDTGAEKSAQMEDGGDNGEGKIEPIVQQTVAARAAPQGKYDKLLDQLLEANGIAGFRAEKSTGLASLAPILGLLEAGYDLERDILQTIRARRKPDARTWSYFVAAIREAGDTRRGIAAQPKPQEADRWPARVKAFRQDGTWASAWGPKPGEPGCEVA